MEETGIQTGKNIKVEKKICESCGVLQLLYGEGIEQYCVCGHKIMEYN